MDVKFNVGTVRAMRVAVAALQPATPGNDAPMRFLLKTLDDALAQERAESEMELDAMSHDRYGS